MEPTNHQHRDVESYWYFGYGTVVNKLVRQRRGIAVVEDSIIAAYLPDYRLTFAVGGMANILPRRGYEVHGILMKLSTAADWDLVKKWDAGSTPSKHFVYPYNNSEEDDDEKEEKEPIEAHFVEFSGEVEDEFLDSPIEVLPEARYLELIAQGLRAHRVSDDYIQDEVMSVPFVPKTKPEDYARPPMDSEYLTSRNSKFSLRRSSSKRHTETDLPLISFEKYKNLCERQFVKGGDQDVLFILKDAVFRITKPDIEKVPAVKWIYRNGHGRPDCSLMLHKLKVDPDIPLADEQEQMTQLHYDFLENQLVEIVIQKYQCSCSKVAMLELSTSNKPISLGDSISNVEKPKSESSLTAKSRLFGSFRAPGRVLSQGKRK